MLPYKSNRTNGLSRNRRKRSTEGPKISLDAHSSSSTSTSSSRRCSDAFIDIQKTSSEKLVHIEVTNSEVGVEYRDMLLYRSSRTYGLSRNRGQRSEKTYSQVNVTSPSSSSSSSKRHNDEFIDIQKTNSKIQKAASSKDVHSSQHKFHPEIINIEDDSDSESQEDTSNEKENTEEEKLIDWKLLELSHLQQRRVNDKYSMTKKQAENWDILETRIIKATKILIPISENDWHKPTPSKENQKVLDNIIEDFLKSKEMNPEEKIKCIYQGCRYIYGSEMMVKFHIRNVHFKEQPFACNLCPARYVSTKATRDHIKLNHIELGRKRDYKCMICGMLLSNALNLHLHTMSGHVDRPKAIFTLNDKRMTLRPPLDEERRFWEIYINMWKFPKQKEILGLSVCSTSINIRNDTAKNWRNCVKAFEKASLEVGPDENGSLKYPFLEKIFQGWRFHSRGNVGVGSGIATNDKTIAKNLELICRKYLENGSFQHGFSAWLSKNQANNIGRILDKLTDYKGCNKRPVVIALPGDDDDV